MNKLFSKIAALSVGLAMAIGVGVAVGSNGVREARAAAPYDFSDSSITFADQGLSNGVQYTDYPFKSEVFSIQFGGGGNDGKYYTTGSGMRTYGDGYFTVSAISGKLAQIDFTWDGNYKPSSNDVADSGTFNSSYTTWTGSASSVKFTRPSGTGHWRLKTVAVTIESGKTATSITINNTKPMALNVGDSPVQLNITKDPSTISVTYSSTNTSVVTVSNTGLVTVVGAGTSTVKASFAGSDTLAASEDSIVVNVSAPEPSHVTNMTISEIVAATTSSTPTVLYEFEGYVTAWQSGKTDGTQYGNFYIADEAGDTENHAQVYGANHNNLPTWDGAKYTFQNNKTFLTDELTSQIEIGTKISVIFMAFMYNSNQFEFQGSIVDIIPETVTLDSITLSGEYPTSFDVGDTFSYQGLEVTAHYSNGGYEVVTPTSVSTPDLSSLGKKTVTVSYTEGETTVSATYEVTVSVKHTISFAAGEGSGTMDSVKVVEGESYTLPACTFDAPEGKVFAGWEVDGQVITQIESVTKDYTATATWKVQTEWEAEMTPGTSGSEAVVNGHPAIKVGTNSSGGDMTIKVGAGATGLKFYAAAWNNVSGLSLNITGATVDPESVDLTADTGVSSSSPFTLQGSEEDYLFEVGLSNITEETTLTFTTSIAKRFVIWGAVYSKGETPVPSALDSIEVSDPKTEYKVGDEFVKPTVTANYEDGSHKDVTAKATFSGFDSSAAVESQLITVSYTENEVQKSTSYTVSIAAIKMNRYRKVESELADYSGKYLIVYEGDDTHDSVAFNGSLSTLDANNNNVAVTISDGVIELSEGYDFTVSALEEGYSIKSSSGLYIGCTTNANNLNTSTEVAYSSSIGFSEGEVSVKASGGSYLRFNYASNTLRFRYYKSASYASQQAVSLYRLVDAESFASLLMSETNADCSKYAGSDPSAESVAAYTSTWNLIKPFYSSMTDAEKTILIKTEEKESGTLIETAMYRYDHIVAKYGVENFMVSRDIALSINSNINEFANDNTSIIIIVIAAASALAFTTLLVFKKKRQK